MGFPAASKLKPNPFLMMLSSATPQEHDNLWSFLGGREDLVVTHFLDVFYVRLN
jgi:hypothetical protein